jgi:DNA-binding response OmpR family regulator
MMKSDILVVDDNPDILTVLKANLQLHGFEVRAAGSCAQARKQLEEKVPDLVVLDRILPDGDGVDLCAAWKKDHLRLPVILLTARDQVSDKVLGLDSGADDYVVKPFEPLELIARIRACLRRVKPHRKEKVTLGEISIDRTSMKVTRRGEPVSLTPKEYQLLCLFAEHTGEVLSRDVIRRHLWKDRQIYSWSRVIDVHVQHLRQKVEDDPSAPAYIFTVLGVGYRFEAPRGTKKSPVL